MFPDPERRITIFQKPGIEKKGTAQSTQVNIWADELCVVSEGVGKGGTDLSCVFLPPSTREPNYWFWLPSHVKRQYYDFGFEDYGNRSGAKWGLCRGSHSMLHLLIFRVGLVIDPQSCVSLFLIGEQSSLDLLCWTRTAKTALGKGLCLDGCLIIRS